MPPLNENQDTPTPFNLSPFSGIAAIMPAPVGTPMYNEVQLNLSYLAAKWLPERS